MSVVGAFEYDAGVARTDATMVGQFTGTSGSILRTGGSISGAGGLDCGAGSFFSVGLLKRRWFNRRGHSRGEPLLDFVFVSKRGRWFYDCII